MGLRLQDMTWLDAQRALTPAALVVLPIGAAAKEHGPHLRLDNDLAMAEGLAQRVLDATGPDVVVAPTLTYHYYPAFAAYPGSASLRLETARDLTVDAVLALAEHGPRRFYALNTGVSTVRALEPAAKTVAEAGLLLRWTEPLRHLEAAVKRHAQQPGGTHADEVETSIMLHLAPERVDMSRAVRDYHPGKGPLTRDAGQPGILSPTGVYGDPTLATPEKGRVFAEALVAGILADIEALRGAPLS